MFITAFNCRQAITEKSFADLLVGVDMASESPRRSASSSRRSPQGIFPTPPACRCPPMAGGLPCDLPRHARRLRPTRDPALARRYVRLGPHKLLGRRFLRGHHRDGDRGDRRKCRQGVRDKELAAPICAPTAAPSRAPDMTAPAR